MTTFYGIWALSGMYHRMSDHQSIHQQSWNNFPSQCLSLEGVVHITDNVSKIVYYSIHMT